MRDTISLAHGAGGRESLRLIEDVFKTAFCNSWLAQGDDGAVMTPLEAGERLVLSTDSHVVAPLFFPGGDIGCLAVHGTVNDVAMMGARPLYLSAGFILEEGFSIRDLRSIVSSMAQACEEAGVALVAGDTKVVEKGKADGVFITTSGIGALPVGRNVSGSNARPGDVILVSGMLGDHGLSILNAREHLGFELLVSSDTAPLNGLVEALFAAVSAEAVHGLRDPTRGGLAATLNEIASQSRVGMVLNEEAIPVRKAVKAACELLGLDPLTLANEGKLIAIVDEAAASAALAALRAHPRGEHASIIGKVRGDKGEFVQIETAFGGTRMLDWMNGDPLPRIC